MGLRGPKAKSVAERFASKIRPGENGCIEWTAGTNGVGYGLFHPNTTTTNRKVYAHRWAYEQRFGPVPDGLHLDHLCRNTICVNPEHLEAVTPRENLLRGVSFSAVNARKTHCPHGHPYAGENVRINSNNGSRICVTCARARDRARRPAKKKEQHGHLANR